MDQATCLPWGTFKYRKLRVIAKGGFCRVYEMESKKDHSLVAIKKVRLSKGSIFRQLLARALGLPLPQVATLKACKEEVNALKDLAGTEDEAKKFVVEFKDAFPNQSSFWIVTEYVQPRDLRTIINHSMVTRTRLVDQKSYKILPIDVIGHLLAPVVDAVNCLQKLDYAHRDLKDSNVLLTVDGVPKLCDFGFVKKCYSDYVGINGDEDGFGTPYYVAPEIIRSESSGKNCDVWAIGVLALALSRGEDMFYSSENRIMWMSCVSRSIYSLIKTEYKFLDDDHAKHPKYPDAQQVLFDIAGLMSEKSVDLECSENEWLEYRDFVTKCLVLKNSDRPAVRTLLHVPFIKNALEQWRNPESKLSPRFFQHTTYVKNFILSSLKQQASKKARTKLKLLNDETGYGLTSRSVGKVDWVV